MHISTTLLMSTLLGTVHAIGNNWTLSCGSSCDALATVANSGDYSTNDQTCFNFPAAFNYCELSTINTATYGLLYTAIIKGEDCVGTEEQETTFNSGVCADVSGYESYIVVLRI